ncbi:MAG: YggS family pyridoxal phosphate-dependent enzyme [Bacteroidia bacterium]|nr:YggS family pyridoxal phosphate-dependent enzyme [Bacteroidia bacterium]
MSIHENFLRIRNELPEQVKIVAVSKTRSVEDMMELYNTGHKIFGENRVPELCKKQALLPEDTEWHMIGHLQTNKVRLIIPFISLIHSVDSLRLLQTIDNEAARAGRVVDCLLQIFIADEKTKFGFLPVEAMELLESSDYPKLKNVRICGLMGMATYTDQLEKIRKEFSFIAALFRKIKHTYFSDELCFKELSIGMSGDYKIAANEGGTIVRIGSAIFGERSQLSL